MFTINNEKQQLTPEVLLKMINTFQSNTLPLLEKYRRYYDGKQEILQKTYADKSKPCNRTVMNYCSDIADSYNGYIAAPGFISYSSNENISEIMDILKYNDYQTEDSDFLRDALIYGVAAELMFIDEDGKTRFRLIDPRTCFGIYDDSLTGDLLYFVRLYGGQTWGGGTAETLVDVYSDEDIKHYSMNASSGGLRFVGEEPHYFSQCPANIFYLQDEKSIFSGIMTLQDAINGLVSSEIDDYQAFCDAYLVLTGCEIDDEAADAMRERRIIELPEGAAAEWLTKNANDGQVENILERLHKAIYRIGKCPDFSSESFTGGVSSGIAIQYKLTGMETKAAGIAAAMKKALQRRLEIICGIASLKIGEEVFADIQIDFRRNIPEDIETTIKNVGQLKGLVSHKTLLSLLSFVPDVQQELEAIQEEQKTERQMYNFGG